MSSQCAELGRRSVGGRCPCENARVKHESAGWKATTHEWADSPDVDHLEQIRRQPGVFAPSGLMHLVLEVLAYAADEAVSNGFGRGVVTLHRDGSVAIADNGRGTDTRVDHRGRKVEKPVMATRDLRFFDSPNAAILPTGTQDEECRSSRRLASG